MENKIKYDVINSVELSRKPPYLPTTLQRVLTLELPSLFYVYYGRQSDTELERDFRLVKEKLVIFLNRTKLNSKTEVSLKRHSKDHEKKREITLKVKALRDQRTPRTKMKQKRELKGNAPSLYYVGETVLVRVSKRKKCKSFKRYLC